MRTHPVSGRKARFVNRIFTTRIVELAQPENDALLQMIFGHLEQCEFQFRFRWQPASVAFWDNRCTQHHAMWNYYPAVFASPSKAMHRYIPPDPNQARIALWHTSYAP